MTEFMKRHKVYLTPISPIHIGCGEDFEPTNYVIDEGVLYHFEPSNLNLDKTKRQELLNKANSMDLLAIQRFFLNNKNLATTQAHYFADVSEGINQIYQQRIGKVAQRESNGKEVIAKLEIERTAYQPYFGLPFIPASSVKGALMTVFLDQKHQAKNNPKIRDPRKEAKKLTQEYIGEYQDSLGRYIKFGDFSPNENVQSKIYFAVNYKRKLDENGKPIIRITSQREAIYSGQYRAFCSDLVVGKVGKDLKERFRDISLTKTEIIRALNQFYLPIFKQELDKLIELGLVNLDWAESVLSLVSNCHIALIRLGKNGSDSKVYQGKGVAQIKIQKLNKNLERATTYWLAANNKKSTAGLLPFGWALLEFDPASENETLKQWCDKQPKSTFNKQVILQKQAELQAEKEQQRLMELEKAREAEEQAKQEQERLNSLSLNQKAVEEFIAKHERSEVKPFADSLVFREIQVLINQALAENWEKADRHYLFELSNPKEGILSLKVPNLKGSKKEKEFNKLRNKLVAE